MKYSTVVVASLLLASAHASNDGDNPFKAIVRRRPREAHRVSFSTYYWDTYRAAATPSLPQVAAPKVLAQNLTGDEIEDSSIGGAGNEEHSHEELFKITTEVTDTHLAITLIPCFTVLFGLFSAFIKEKLYAGEAIIAVVIGILFGPYVAGVFDPRAWGNGAHFDEITLEFTRVVIAMSVFAVGVELPRKYMLKHWRSLTVLLGPLMLFGWLISAGFIVLFVPGINFLQALVAAAAVTPTDPILAASVVGKGKYAQKHVPAHLRHILQAESGSNDGAAFPFLYLAMFMLLREDRSIGESIGQWLLLIVFYQIILGIVIGAIVGIMARKLLKFGKRRSTIDRESMVAMYIALALFTTGATVLAGSDDLLAAFACGTAFAWDNWFTESIEESNFSNIIDLLINCTTFIYLGATIPFSAYNDSLLTLVPWKMVMLGICVLLFRRLPALLMLSRFVPDIKTFREAIFCGHFGPMGVGAIFISTLAQSKLPTPSVPPESSMDILALTVQPLSYLLVLCSVLVHGLSIPFFSLGGKLQIRVHSMTRTWTQASGNEPNWLNRVKRVDRSGAEVGNSNVEKQDSNETRASPDLSDTLEKGEYNDRETGEGFPEMSERQRQLEDEMLAAEAEGSSGSGSRGDVTPQDSGIEALTEEEEGRRLTRPGLAVVAEELETVPPKKLRGRGLSAPTIPLFSHESKDGHRPRLFGLHSLALMSGHRADEGLTEDEILVRDAWCRRERRDNPKRGQTTTYVSGNTLIVESSDGDVVDVRDAKTGKSIVSGETPLTSNSAPVGSGSGEGSDKKKSPPMQTARLLARRFSMSKGNDHQKQGGMPAPGSGPRSHLNRNDSGVRAVDFSRPSPILEEEDKEAGIEDAKETSYSEKGETRWVEGDKMIIERDDGEDVQVRDLTEEEKKDHHDRKSKLGQLLNEGEEAIESKVKEEEEEVEKSEVSMKNDIKHMLSPAVKALHVNTTAARDKGKQKREPDVVLDQDGAGCWSDDDETADSETNMSDDDRDRDHLSHSTSPAVSTTTTTTAPTTHRPKTSVRSPSPTKLIRFASNVPSYERRISQAKPRRRSRLGLGLMPLSSSRDSADRDGTSPTSGGGSGSGKGGDDEDAIG